VGDVGDWAMVWIMSMPTGFGEFWPSGGFEDVDQSGSKDWIARLRAHISSQPEEAQKKLMPSGAPYRYGYFVAQKFKTEIGEQPAADLPPVTPVLAHEAPKTFNTAKTNKKLGDLIMLNSRILAVSEGLKAIIEDLEPGIHQFFPIDIVQPRSIYPTPFYTIVIGNYRNSFRDVEAVMPELPDGERYTFTEVDKAAASKMYFDRSVFGSAHIWRERAFNEFIINFSDKFVQSAIEANMRLPKLYQAKEFD
jgi:hypothetical protein